MWFHLPGLACLHRFNGSRTPPVWNQCRCTKLTAECTELHVASLSLLCDVWTHQPPKVTCYPRTRQWTQSPAPSSSSGPHLSARPQNLDHTAESDAEYIACNISSVHCLLNMKLVCDVICSCQPYNLFLYSSFIIITYCKPGVWE